MLEVILYYFFKGAHKKLTYLPIIENVPFYTAKMELKSPSTTPAVPNYTLASFKIPCR